MFCDSQSAVTCCTGDNDFSQALLFCKRQNPCRKCQRQLFIHVMRSSCTAAIPVIYLLQRDIEGFCDSKDRFSIFTRRSFQRTTWIKSESHMFKIYFSC